MLRRLTCRLVVISLTRSLVIVWSRLPRLQVRTACLIRAARRMAGGRRVSASRDRFVVLGTTGLSGRSMIRMSPLSVNRTARSQRRGRTSGWWSMHRTLPAWRVRSAVRKDSARRRRSASVSPGRRPSTAFVARAQRSGLAMPGRPAQLRRVLDMVHVSMYAFFYSD